jgi:hypothetical protein
MLRPTSSRALAAGLPTITVNHPDNYAQRLVAEMDPVPYAMVQQAQRRAALRTELLASGAFTYRALSDGKRISQPAVRQWIRRARDRHELFTVEHGHEALVPALLLNQDLSTQPEYQPVIEALVGAGEDSWGLWAWLVSPTPWLDGKVPVEELRLHPEAVAEAAHRRASNAA